MQADEKVMHRLGKGESPSPLEARAGTFLGEALKTQGLDDGEVAAIERRLQRKDHTGRSLRLWPVLAAVAVLLAAGSVMALVGGWRLPFVGGASRSDAPSPPAKSRSANKLGHRPSEASPELRNGAPTPTGAAAPAESPTAPSVATGAEGHASLAARRVPHQDLSPPSASSPIAPAPIPPAESALSVEARSMADALARWRRDRSGEAALALLGAHDRRFPHGSLSVESKVARAEILLGLARGSEALAVLDSLNLAVLPRARELATIRGELRARAGRCREARADLSSVLARTGTDDLGRRALRARAECP